MRRRTLARVVDDSAAWTERISAAWQKGAEAILETGRLLVEAKAALPHGQFIKMLGDERFPFERRTASRLMSIANGRLAKGSTWTHLPPEIRTLIELTKLDDGAYALAEERGLIRPDVTRKEIVALRQEVAPSDPKPAPRFEIASEESMISDFCERAMNRWPPTMRKRLSEVLRYYAELIERSVDGETQ